MLLQQYCREISEIVGVRCAEVPGATAALEALRADGVRIFLNSATPHEDLLLAVRKRGWERHFSGIMGRPRGVAVGASKAANLRQCMEETGANAEEVIVVGDGETDRACATEVGCAFVGVRGERPFAVELEHLAQDMLEALGMIRQLLAEAPSRKRARGGARAELRRVLQTDFTPGKGNALQAAVASVLDLELAAVPNFVAAPEGYEAALRTWLPSQGRRLCKVVLDAAGRLAPGAAGSAAQAGAPCVVRGTSPRGDHGHVVAGRLAADAASVELVHDPHPDGTMLRPPLVWIALFPPTAPDEEA